MTTLIGAKPGAALALGGDEYQWRAAAEPLTLRLNGRELAALDASRQFLTRDEHAARLGQVLGLGGSRAARVVDALLERGALFDPIEWITRDVPAMLPSAPEPLVVLRSWRRHDSLKLLCDSLLADEQRWGTRRRYLVIDDDADPAPTAINAATAQAFARATSSEVRFVGHSEREAALAALARALPKEQHADLRELFDPALAKVATGGRSWNLALLAAAGGSLSMLDNDLAFPMRQLGGGAARYELRNSIASSVRYPDAPEYDAFPVLATDPIEYALAPLGQPARALLAQRGFDAASLHGRDASNVEHLTRDARVLACFGGVYGSLAFDNTMVLHATGRDSLEDLFRAPFRIERLAHDHVFYGVAAPRLTSYATYTPLALDCRELLPFVGTWSRVEDTFFLGLLKAMAPEGCFQYLDASVGHFQVEARDRLAAASRALLLDHKVFVAQYLADATQALRSRDRAVRLAAIGAVASDLDSSSDSVVADELLRWRHSECAGLAERIAAQLAAYPAAPPAWRDTVARSLEANRAAVGRLEVAPAELDHLRNTLRQTAAVCRFWPTLFDFAREEKPLDGVLQVLS